MATGRHRQVSGRPVGLPPLATCRPPARPCRCRRGGGHRHAHAVGVLHVRGAVGCRLPGQPAGRPSTVRLRGAVALPDVDGAEPSLHQCRGGTGGAGSGRGRGAIGHRTREPRRGDGRQDPGARRRRGGPVHRGGQGAPRAPPGRGSPQERIPTGHLRSAQPRDPRPAGPGFLVGGAGVGVDWRRGQGHVPVLHPDPANGDPRLHVPGDAALGGGHGSHQPRPGRQPRSPTRPGARRRRSGGSRVRLGGIRVPVGRQGCVADGGSQADGPATGACRPFIPDPARRVGCHGRCHRVG